MTRFPCPCCQTLVFTSPAVGDYSICPICQWEDDPSQADDPNYEGGANRMSLNQARDAFLSKKAGINMNFAPLRKKNWRQE